MNPEIIYSDRDIIAINKPPGMAIHGGFSVSGKTVVDFLVEKFPEMKTVGDDPAVRPGIVHRLDKNTSGVMIAARNQESFDALKKMFQERRVEKVYRAIVCGRVKTARGIISFPIGRMARNPLKRGAERGKAQVRGAREAATEYRLIRANNIYSLIELCPKTGRMHQLRVHIKEIGHPVACDTIYGGKNVCCPAGILRQLLHAQSLSFSFPEGRNRMFEADPPEDFLLAQRLIV